ncbi:MAG: V-type ATPase subunit [Clostridiaceae bacterium]|nr:V-type ATPase subunit [Clostridiaceae bacterium]
MTETLTKNSRRKAAGERPAGSRGRYGYASGRIRALEMQLLDTGHINRLLDARSPDESIRILTECGYPAAADPETVLKRERLASYALMQTLMPDTGYMDTLMLFHDIQNLKVILKNLVPGLPQESPANHEDTGELPDFGSGMADLAPSRLESFMQQPSLVRPAVLIRAIGDRQPDAIPAWIYQLAVKALRRYQSSYDISDLDLLLDQNAYGEAHKRAAQLGNSFFSQYLQMRTDMINLDLLLRTRFLRSGEYYLEKALLPGGLFGPDLVLALYRDNPESIAAFYARTPYQALAEQGESYGQRGSAARFSLQADNLIMDHIGKARRITSGPEVPLAYLIAREMEIKNIRIILTFQRNGLPMAEARDLIRKSYLTWR